MKNFIFVLFAFIGFISCNNVKSNGCPVDENTINEDSVYTDTIPGINNELIENFFDDFQKVNRDITGGKDRKLLIKEFREKMVNDIEFAKAAASYNNTTFNNMFYGCVVAYMTHSEFTKENGKHGVNNVYDIVVNIPAGGYNTCDVTVAVKYQVVCEMMIADDNRRPNVYPIVKCEYLDEPVVDNEYADVLDLGTYYLVME